MSRLSVIEGKKQLAPHPARGRLVKTCQGSGEAYACCNLKTLSLVSNCPMECTYCFLQFYLNDGATRVLPDTEAAVEQLRALSASDPGVIFRVGTGELSDSLALDRHTGFTRRLIEAAHELPNVVLELKTKTDKVAHLLDAPAGRTVFAWSLNTPYVVEREELKTASLKKRLRAAERVAQAGFHVAFHFDPIFHYPGAEEAYVQVARGLLDRLPEEKIVWISLGTLRFSPKMAKDVLLHYPDSMVNAQELFLAEDGKLRLPRFVRLKLYRSLAGYLKQKSRIFLYLCMEFPDLWGPVLGWTPRDHHDLDLAFQQAIREKMPALACVGDPARPQ